jgi:hypothetical protein
MMACAVAEKVSLHDTALASLRRAGWRQKPASPDFDAPVDDPFDCLKDRDE